MHPPERFDQPAWMSKYYESTPWDIKDIESCLSRHEEPSYEISIEPRFDDHENIRQSLMSAGQKPGYNDPLIYLLKIIEENAYYSILEGESGEKILLLFTSPHRAIQYICATGSLEREPGILEYSPLEWEHDSKYFQEFGLTHIALNKCPYCSGFYTVPILSARNKDDLLKIWSVDTATKIIRYQYFLEEMQLKLNRGDVRSARELGEYTVTHVEAEDPHVHLLLAECGIRQNDSELINRKTRIIGMFGDEWIAKLEKLKSGYNN